MIRSICLNPVIDRVYYINDFNISRKFMEIQPQSFAGGKGVNIARVVSQLGERCALYAFVGGNGGNVIIEDMEKYGVDFTYFSTKGETRYAIDIMDLKNKIETEITEPGVPISAEEEKLFLHTLKNDLSPEDIVVCSGIPMPGMSLNIYQKVSEICRQKRAKCILDTDGKYFLPSFPGCFYFAKPNLNELKAIFGVKGELDGAQVAALAKRAMDKGIENFLLSRGKDGGLLFTAGGIIQAGIPKVSVKSSIGSGDATVAGFCVGTGRGLHIEECLRLAMACGISNAMHEQVGFVDKETVEKLLPQISITHPCL